MNHSNDSLGAGSQFSLIRLTTALVGIFLVAAIGYWYGANSVELQIPNEGRVLKNFGLDSQVKNHLDDRFADEDGDLVADPPSNDGDWVDPETLLFSYGTSLQAYHNSAEVWTDLIKHLSEQTGKSVEFVPIESPQEQVLAFSEGRLHIVGTNPGSVPLLVDACGFVPVCTAGKDGKLQTYTMQIIVPANSTAQKPSDLRGRMVTLTDPSSNSGWKAPLMILLNDFGLKPMTDYLTNYSGSHIASITGIAAGEYQAAAVANTEVMRAIERGDIAENQVRVIYDSKPFPYDCIGYIHNLKPQVGEKVRDALVSFPWAGTSLEREFQQLGFGEYVALSYKQDLALVRDIDDATGNRHSLETAFRGVVPGR